MKRITFLMFMACLFAFNAYAQDTATATATAEVVTPISITKTVDMNFGNVAVTGTAGTVVLGTNGSRTETGGVTLPSTTGTVAAASFDVTGDSNYTYSITLPTSYTITHQVDGTKTMTVDTFTSNPSGTGALTAGAQTLAVGATLNVGATQTAGTYTNATGFDVTVNYN